jgi:hypothetical protein
MLLLAGAAALAAAAPATAQSSSTYRTRTVLVYGDDPCPKSENPDEIIVCARRPEDERYRIPKQIREAEQAANIADNVPAQRSALISTRNSAAGTGSCSPAGAGGWTGCTQGLDVIGGAKTIVNAVGTAVEPDD